MLKGYVTVAEAARMISEPEHQIRRRIANGELRGTVKIGASWVIPVPALKALSATSEAAKGEN